MAQNADNWVQMYDIQDTSKHRKGFTLYKIISLVYPRNCPDAITKLTVWKRYNDIKNLHKEMRSRHQALYLKDKFPVLPKTSYFKRFDEEIIEQRKQSILTLLDFIAKHPQLFKSNEFVKFFETSHTPLELLSSSINTIRAKLNLPMDTEFSTSTTTYSDEEGSFSDTDSICTLSSVNVSVQGVDITNDPLYKSTANLAKLSKKISSEFTSKTPSSDSRDSSSLNLTLPSENGASLTESQVLFPTPPATPDGAGGGGGGQYVVESEKYIALADDYENKYKFEEAFSAYKQAISVLLNGVKGDKDANRRQMVKYKTEKCLLRAEKIYNLHLSTDLSIIKDLCASAKMHEKVQISQNVTLPKPLSELHKYKVLKIVGSGMLVLHSESQQLYFIKVIQTSSNYDETKSKTVLPKNVPYMIKMHTYYQYEDSIFLILEYSSGNKLNEHIKERYCSVAGDSYANFENEMKDFNNKRDGSGDCGLDPDSDCSYSDLINDYVSKDVFDDVFRTRTEEIGQSAGTIDSNKRCSSERDSTDGSWDLCGGSVTSSTDGSVKNHPNRTDASGGDDDNDNIDINLETNHLLLQSQELLSSIESTLIEVDEKERKMMEKKKKKMDAVAATAASKRSAGAKEFSACSESAATKQRKFSEKSLSLEFDYLPSAIVPHRVVVKWASQLLIAIEKLHESGVICGYLSLNHLLIDEKGDLVLTYRCNINLNRVFFEKWDINLAPDLYLCNEPTFASDWWCYGALLYELLTGMCLRYGHPEGISSFTLLRIPRYVSAEGKSLLNQLLTFEPHDRLGCGINGTEDLKSHPFFHSVDWDKLYDDSKRF